MESYTDINLISKAKIFSDYYKTCFSLQLSNNWMGDNIVDTKSVTQSFVAGYTDLYNTYYQKVINQKFIHTSLLGDTIAFIHRSNINVVNV